MEPSRVWCIYLESMLFVLSWKYPLCVTLEPCVVLTWFGVTFWDVFIVSWSSALDLLIDWISHSGTAGISFPDSLLEFLYEKYDKKWDSISFWVYLMVVVFCPCMTNCDHCKILWSYWVIFLGGMCNIRNYSFGNRVYVFPYIEW